MPTNEFRAAPTRINSSSLTCMAALSRFCEFWMRNTIRNVTMVVPVLMTSCHVSEKPKSGSAYCPYDDDSGRQNKGRSPACR